MALRTSLLAILAVLGTSACNVDNDADGAMAQFDCDDNNAAIGPEAAELCDGLDNDCNGVIDDNTTDAPTFYADFDRDGFGDANATTTDCRFDPETGGPDPTFQPFGYVTNSDDCDDALKTVNPDADERCDTIDNNCDDDVDGDDAIDKATWYADSDNDGFGDLAVTSEACDQPTGYVANDEDCNDDKATMNPDEAEVCDGDDNDCDGERDEDDAVDADAWFRDADGDGFGDVDESVFACDKPVGYVSDDRDCDDEAATAFPGGTEVCDGFDNDCNAATSEAGLVHLNAKTKFTTIQQALDAASSGDTVYVCAGTWSEDLIAPRAVSLVGPSGSEQTIIEGAGNGSVVRLNADGSRKYTLRGLTLRGGDAGEGYGGGLDAWNVGELALEDVVFNNNTAFLGGGFVGPSNGKLTATDVRAEGNEAYAGGGAYLVGGAVSDSRFVDNLGYAGGGLTVEDGSVKLENVRILSNYAEFGGGGLAILDGATVDGGLVQSNLSDEFGGGVWLDGTLKNATVTKNRATDGGGGVAFASDGSTLETCAVTENKAAWGGGVWSDGSDMIIQSTDILNNTATATGGGGWQEGASATLTNSAVEGNTATAGGGWHLLSGTMSVSTSDWGAGVTENSPDDIYADQSDTSYKSFGAGESFTCSSSGSCL